MHKPSQHNYFINHNSKIIYYNAFTRNCFALTEDEHANMQKHFTDPISFELAFPTVFKLFRKQGFFVDYDVDEDIFYRYQYYKDVTFNKELHFIIDFEYPESSIEQEWLLKHIEQKFDKNHYPLICIEWRGKEINSYMDTLVEPVTNHIKQLCESSDCKFRSQIQSEKYTTEDWYPLSAPRVNQYTIQNSGEVYWGYPFFNKDNLWGKFISDGTIEWNERKREVVLGMPWFDKAPCTKCKDYMLYAPLCAYFRQQHLDICLLENEDLSPEKIIISEFESKDKTNP